ncbi:MAG: 16S rRNA (cytidine(1402)-2'-O)-methyltransferase [Oscillospiraceae bacterium]|nr:16S rRNA (cytidine(1402)-2'-O)-methyltransferase [Oscillospiraceae bacterium]
MHGTLYVTGTPIGNLGDISARGLETLAKADFIAAEDTRVSLKLLSRYGIKKPLISCRKHNIRETAAKIAERLQGGESCALITDAGMPCVSDPGADVVRVCRDADLDVEVVPGPSALVAALALSGFECRRFSFEGFLSVNPRPRRERLLQLQNYDGLLILYEAPHKLRKTLSDLHKTLGNRKIAVCRELTKIHEEVLCGTLEEMIARYEETQPRGEFVLVLDAPPQQLQSQSQSQSQLQSTLQEAVKIAVILIQSGKKPAEACKIAAWETGFAKSEIYRGLTNNTSDD